MKPAYRRSHHQHPPPGRIPLPTGPLPPVPDLSTRRVELSDAALVSRSWAMAFATLVSRITGFARIVVLAAILGAALSSAFSVANQLPNLVAALVLEATFTAIFVPVLARAEQSDPDGGAAFVRRLVTVTTALLAFATVVSVVAAPLLVRLMLGRSPQVNEPLTTAFAYLLLPQVLAYGLTSVFMAILNTRNVFGPTAWAPVVNNVVALVTLGVYLAVPGELSVDPVRMGNAKLLVLAIGTTLGVYAQTAILLIALRRERISLRPLWGIDARLKRFGAMAVAMVLYVLISQLGLVVGNQIASTAAASGPAIYNYTWLVLMLPFGMIGVTVLTVVMPRLSRNAAADDTRAVLADLSLATRLTLVTLIPIVAFMTVGGPAIGSALFAYGHFGGVDAGYLGAAIALSAFTLIPYGLVLLQLRVFYAREQPWTPIVVILVITAVKIAGSVLAPHVTHDPQLVAGYLGLANGLGFLIGAIVGYYLLRRVLLRRGGHLVGLAEIRTVLVTVVASMLAGLIAHVVDRLLGLAALTAHGGAAGSLLRLLVLGAIMAPVIVAVMVRAQVPEAVAAAAAVRRRIGRGAVSPTVAPGSRPAAISQGSSHRGPVTYPEQRNSSPPGVNAVQDPIRRRPPDRAGDTRLTKGPEVTDRPLESAASGPGSGLGSGGDLPRPPAGDFQPDISAERKPESSGPLPPEQRNGGPHERDAEAASDDGHLVPGARIAGGRYRLLVFHGGAPPLQFWQALDTALDRQVSLTFVDPDGALPEAVLQEILSRTLRLSRIDKPGIARVLDVVHSDRGGLVVAEWIRGGSLQEVADTAPSPVGAVRAMQALAAAADTAHRTGVALSIDHPSRVRVSIEGDVVLAYPATMPDANPEDDIRGIGASLYALLVNRWPLPEFGVRSGLAPADRDGSGLPVEPNAIDRDIPFQISAVAVRAVQEDGGIRSASTLLNLLQQATAVADRTEVLGPIDDSPPPAAPRVTGDEHLTLARRRRNLMIGGAAALAIIVVALLVLASIVSRIFGNVGGGLNKDELGLNGPGSSSSSSSSANPAPAGSVVKPTRATVFSPDGDPDNASTAGQAIDGDPTTAWATEVYTDAVPFPSFKVGEGLILQLPKPTVVGQVTIDTPSTGTKIEIRAASTASPAKLDDTTVLAPAFTLKPGHNVIPVKAGSPTSNLLVWISTLGTTNGKSQAGLSEITVRAAS
ncbi:murein biosynthesis integral membrane protein MurJ [Mycobacterium montefiorense]|uniref:Peptidoglycan biosynthesis protein MviN n=3 Tax=Mycobacterium montefiorense TaxID=154654 RepID=A0AA37PMF8_9MYCO|nr:murein biosynthesis integral membrane protein MurJ [Mycobacterium montefiorense]GBG40994.1 putative peptidoglycan biosynthesis protein MviN [Mycobacterium montefiorense]GKU35094.1 putative peptidoglycan biosynthesis protein MviN [Mycobacterium montefiorense]GKU41221.1 putative peptidoglycan biosynthesis protein MviN [Mycobacterium montefiorense]GKU49498.1 putative peptidoglycan biosynthesis protein MviN [Mycobacterium montefiorense]GKU55897.1 putative peptidoglycan biosynthesis protein MviN